MSDQLASYLFVIDSSTMSRDDAMNIVDTLSEIVNWQKILPDAAVLVSSNSVNDLQKLLREKMPGQRFMLVGLERANKNGWLAKNSWDFMNNPKHVSAG
jgi:hypothetical protein